ncbi:MAG TPA: 6,7-dimethyl-8-ribityllumazine synthase [Phnomibacter sp.]|nr:6,7-dimethyl-8-ribityllumazine synthase [Phnomibacter sp.]
MASAGNEAILNGVTLNNATALQVVIVKTGWNADIVDTLEAGALRVLQQAGVGQVETITVPGAVEIPFAVNAIDQSASKAHAYIALGCVIRGDTPHFDYVCQSVTQGITALNTQLNSPVIFGVLTVNNEAQAWERLGGAHGHKGEEAGLTCLHMLQLKERFSR